MPRTAGRAGKGGGGAKKTRKKINSTTNACRISPPCRRVPPIQPLARPVPSSPFNAARSRLRRRLHRAGTPRAADELRDVVLQLLVLRGTDVNHVPRLVVAVRDAVDDLLLVRE